MGYYINVKDMSKEEFLAFHGGVPSQEPPDFDEEVAKGKLPVCWVHNGAFTAAGICYDKRELEAFNQPDDKRPKLWFSVPREQLEQFMK